MSFSMIFFGVNVTLLLIVWWFALQWYVMPTVRRLPLAQGLQPILLLHMTRANGAGFLIAGVVSADLPLSMAGPAAYGDLLAALLAFIALLALRNRWSSAMIMLWLFNIVGFADLLNVMRLVVVNNVDPGQLGSMYLIVVAIVPGLLLTHIEVFRILLHHKIDTSVAS